MIKLISAEVNRVSGGNDKLYFGACKADYKYPLDFKYECASLEDCDKLCCEPG